ncbi:hypothetical protein [Glutamicibacter sp.]|jgi:hypothetical protein|nr:hypothetical protein [Glutamicibacter sp.]HJX79179.1 hypothetical protein [Glutamicibacter sp.]
MNIKFKIEGYANGPDEPDTKMYLEELIKDNDKMHIVQRFGVEVEEID